MDGTEREHKPNGSLSPAEKVLALAAEYGVPEAPNGPTPEKPESYPHDVGCFEVSSAGVYWCKNDGAKKRVCDELRVEAQTRDSQDGNWGLLLTWKDGDGKRHREQLPLAALHGDSADAARLLASGGLSIAPGRAVKLREYLLVCKPEARARSVEKVGWHGMAYVTPSGTIGDTAGERVEFQGASGVNTDYGRSGSAEGWRSMEPRASRTRAVQMSSPSIGRAGGAAKMALGSTWGPPQRSDRRW